MVFCLFLLKNIVVFFNNDLLDILIEMFNDFFIKKIEKIRLDLDFYIV